MKYLGALISVSDIERSKAFYCGLLKMNIVGDFGANVQLDGGLFLQTLDSWKGFIGQREVSLRHNAGELYFETLELDSFLSELAEADIEYVHEPVEHSWGQRAVRFYDPDHNIIEVAEALTVVMKRFLDSGMSVKQVAKRMDVGESYVRSCLGGQ